MKIIKKTLTKVMKRRNTNMNTKQKRMKKKNTHQKIVMKKRMRTVVTVLRVL